MGWGKIGMPLDERAVQRGAMRLLGMRGLLAVHVPNGSHLSGDAVARAKQMNALKRDGLSTGFVDLLVFGKRPGQLGFMECKREKGGKLGPDQIVWRDRLVELEWPWALITTPEQAIEAVTRWGWLS